MNTCSFRHCERKATYVLILQYEAGECVEVEVRVCQRHAASASSLVSALRTTRVSVCRRPDVEAMRPWKWQW
jgi:hypothetical protein